MRKKPDHTAERDAGRTARYSEALNGAESFAQPIAHPQQIHGGDQPNDDTGPLHDSRHPSHYGVVMHAARGQLLRDRALQTLQHQQRKHANTGKHAIAMKVL